MGMTFTVKSQAASGSFCLSCSGAGVLQDTGQARSSIFAVGLTKCNVTWETQNA